MPFNPATIPSSSSGLTLISSTVAGGAIASFDITGIVQTYTALQLMLFGRGDTVATSVGCRITFNGDSSAIYDFESINATGNAGSPVLQESLAQTSSFIGSVAAASATATMMGMIYVDIPHYAGTTFQKGFISRQGDKVGTAAGNLSIMSVAGSWRSAAAINRITITPSAGNFVTGSTLEIFGVQ